MDLKDDVLYLLRVDFDCFIVNGQELNKTLKNIYEHKQIVVFDIANNYLQKPCTDETKISYQELYQIKGIYLK